MDIEALNKAMESIAEAFSLLNEKIEVVADVFREMLDSLYEEDEKQNGTSPKTYGLAKIGKARRNACKPYHYIPIIRKHLPYQRRSY
jgi:hypothetical protein